MGTSTNAILAFGFDLGEELPKRLTAYLDPEDDERFDMEMFIIHELKLPPLAYKELKAEIDSFPVDIIEHCSRECPMYFLAVRGTQKVANRGYPQAVVAKPMAPDRVKALLDFCERYDIPTQQPEWYIFSMWS